MSRNLVAAVAAAGLFAFGSAAHAQLWTWMFQDRGVGYSLTFESLSGNVGTFALGVDTRGYNQQPAPAYLDSVDIKAWGGTNISFTLLSGPSGTAWTPTEGAITSGKASGTGCSGNDSGFACVEAITKSALNVADGPYNFRFAVTADSFYTANLGGVHVGAGYADGTGAGAGYGITSMISPIPEPEIYAMLLAGFGLIGFVARRRRQNLAAV